MKNFTFGLLIVFAVAISTTLPAQVDLNRSINLSGSGTDAKVSGIKTVSDPEDAVNVATLQKGNLIYSTASGSGAYTVALTPAPASYTAGMVINFSATSANTGASTLTVAPLTAKSIRKNGVAELEPGDIAAGQAVSVIYDGTHFQMVGTPRSSAISNLKNLYITSTSVSALNITADRVLLDNYDVASGVNVNVSISASGANGLDAGGEAANTWYYIWVVKGSSGIAGLLSTSSTSPSLPAGYNQGKRRVGAIRNNGNSDLFLIQQQGSYVACDEVRISSNFVGTASFTSLDISTLVPPVTRRARIAVTLASSGNNSYWYYRPTGSGWPTGTIIGHAHTSPSHLSHEADIILSSGRSFDVRKSDGTSVQALLLNLAGWYDPLEF